MEINNISVSYIHNYEVIIRARRNTAWLVGVERFQDWFGLKKTLLKLTCATDTVCKHYMKTGLCENESGQQVKAVSKTTSVWGKYIPGTRYFI